VLGWCGIIAIQHGNVIEVNTGVVGIDEACSGIRSFQATLMISLFLGEVYRLSVLRRVLCVLAGFGLAFLFNTGRTFVLVYVAARKGVEAIAHWHDPAGISILVGCFIGLWLAVLALRPKVEGGGARGEGRNQQAEQGGLSLVTRASAVLFPSPLRRLAVGLLVWLLFVECGIQMWYRHLESDLPRGPEWAIVWPEENPTFKESPVSVWVRSALQFDEGRQAEWWEAGGIRWQAFYLHWFPGRAAGYLAKRHTPEICLPSAGLSLGSASELMLWDVHGLRLPFRKYVFTDGQQTVHVFHCRWEEGVRPEAYIVEGPTLYSRIRGVWAGRGNLNQKVLELAVWGIDDAQEAEASALRQLDRLVQVAKPKGM